MKPYELVKLVLLLGTWSVTCDYNFEYGPSKESSFVEDVTCFTACMCHTNAFNCRKPNTLTAIPKLFNNRTRLQITEIIIENQPGLHVLTSEQVSPYPYLEKLTVLSSGLRYIELTAFSNTARLREVNFRNNSLTVLKREIFENLTILELTVDGNPLACNCTNKWLQLEMGDGKGGILGPIWEQVTCLMDEKHIPLAKVQIPMCEKPRVNVTPEVEELFEGQKVTLTCTGWGTPKPRLSWETKDLNSNFTIVDVDDDSDFLYQDMFYNESSLNREAIPEVDQRVGQTKILIIEKANGTDGGLIKCQAENIVGVESQSVQITINFPPRIKVLQTHKGFFWSIHYRIYGCPLPNRTWLMNNKPLQLNNNTRDEETASNRPYYKVDGYLVLERVTPVNDGIYTLVVQNVNGEDNRSLEAQFHKIEMSPYNINSMSSRNFQPPNPPKPVSVKKITGTGRPEVKVLLHSASKWSIIVCSCLIGVAAIFGVVFFVQRYRRSQRLKRDRHRRASPTSTRESPENRDRSLSRLFPSLCCADIHSRGTPGSSRNTRKSEQLICREKIPLNSGKVVDNPTYCQDESIVVCSAGIPQIAREKISFIQTLGEGAFGRVFLGTVDYLSPDEPTTMVAVKTLKESSVIGETHPDDSLTADFYREAELLSSLKHGNIVRFFGISVDAEPPMMVFEYMEHGDLNGFLRLRSPELTVPEAKSIEKSKSLHESLSLNVLLAISLQIAHGVEYLASQHFIHRDLATRNCLVGSEPLVVKIGDFGMSRDVYSTDYYRVGRHTMLPIRWMSPESILYRKFTLESDVWSLGVVLWEVFTHGRQPWCELSNHEVVQEVTNGKLLLQPQSCPDDVYRLMVSCWKTRPQDRLSALELRFQLERFVNHEPEYIEVLA